MSWTTVSPSQRTWEQEALDFVRQNLAPAANIHVWSNFEFVADNGSIYEVGMLSFLQAVDQSGIAQVPGAPAHLISSICVRRDPDEVLFVTLNPPERNGSCQNNHSKPFIETTEAEFDSMFAINSKADYFFIQEAGKRMRDGGKIVTIVTSLLAAFTGLYSTYAGSKAPVEHFTRAAAKEFGPRGISVNNIAPGPMDTPFFYPAESPETIAYHKSQSMNGKLTDIKDIAPIVKFLVTDGWWITGQTIFANGGYTTR